MKITRFFLVAAMFAAAILVFPHLPDPAPIHWNLAGEPDNFASKIFVAFLFPTISLVCLILFPLLAKIDPKKMNYPKFQKSWEALQTLLIAIFAYFFAVQLFVTIFPENQNLMPRLMFAGIGLLFVAIGNLMGKIRQNFFVGLKTPWTLADPEVWQKSQRVAGWSFVVGGIIFLGLALVGDVPRLGAVFLSTTFAMIIFPIFYSYFAFKSKNSRK